MSDTPKTDAFISKFYKSRPLSSGSRHRTDVELHDFARQLERELTALREELKNCSAQFDRQQEQLDRNAEQIATLRQCLRNVYEVWAGSEGIPAPTVASEAYLLSLVEQMRDAAKEGLTGG